MGSGVGSGKVVVTISLRSGEGEFLEGGVVHSLSFGRLGVRRHWI